MNLDEERVFFRNVYEATKKGALGWEARAGIGFIANIDTDFTVRLLPYTVTEEQRKVPNTHSLELWDFFENKLLLRFGSLSGPSEEFEALYRLVVHQAYEGAKRAARRDIDKAMDKLSKLH